MYRTDALTWALPLPPASQTASATKGVSAAAQAGRTVDRRWRGPLVELTVAAAASATMALMVIVASNFIGQTAPRATATTLTMASITEDIDPRDSAVANGAVTPWMERARASEQPTAP